jgi:hypothetical protein
MPALSPPIVRTLPLSASLPQLTISSCSAACSTIHKPTHPAASPAPPAPAPAAPRPSTIPRPGTISAAGFREPFAGLDESTELRALFARYPRLRTQLEEIYAATQAPGGSQWTADRGLENGAVALGRARAACGPDGEGVREFSRLVLRVVGGEGSVDVIQREVAEENARIVEQLLRGEM